MSGAIGRRLAWSIWGSALVFTAVGLLLLFPNRSTLGGGSLVVVPSVFLPGLGYATIGALIAARQPKNPIGWILAALGLTYAITFFGSEYAILGLHTTLGSLPAATFVGCTPNPRWSAVPGVTLKAVEVAPARALSVAARV